MAKRTSPQTFEKRQRERRKQQERADKFERRQERKAEKRRLKVEGESSAPPPSPARPDPGSERSDSG